MHIEKQNTNKHKRYVAQKDAICKIKRNKHESIAVKTTNKSMAPNHATLPDAKRMDRHGNCKQRSKTLISQHDQRVRLSSCIRGWGCKRQFNGKHFALKCIALRVTNRQAQLSIKQLFSVRHDLFWTTKTAQRAVANSMFFHTPRLSHSARFAFAGSMNCAKCSWASFSSNLVLNIQRTFSVCTLRAISHNN